MQHSSVGTFLFACQIINMYGELIMEKTQHKVKGCVLVLFCFFPCSLD